MIDEATIDEMGVKLQSRSNFKHWDGNHLAWAKFVQFWTREAYEFTTDMILVTMAQHIFLEVPGLSYCIWLPTLQTIVPLQGIRGLNPHRRPYNSLLVAVHQNHDPLEYLISSTTSSSLQRQAS